MLVELSSCQKISEFKDYKEMKVDTVDYRKTFKVNDSVNAQYTARILIFPELKEKSIEKNIYRDYDFTAYSPETLSYYFDEQSSALFARSDKIFKRYPQRLNLFFHTDMKVLYRDNRYLNLQYYWITYEGGSHPNDVYKDKVFDLKKGVHVHLSDLLTIPNHLLSKMLMENYPKAIIRESRGLTHQQLLIEKVIPVPENFYFDQQYFYFHFQPYDITEYKAGDVVIPISIQDLKPYLAVDFKGHMNIK